MRRALALVALGLVLCGGAQAARLTPSTRASSQATSAGAQSASVNIPSTTTYAVVTFNWASLYNNNAPTSVTLDGHAATKVISSEASGPQDAAIYTVAGFSTGSSKTLAWTNPNAQVGIDVAIEYRDGTPTYGATDTDYDSVGNSGDLSSNPLSNTSGDEILCGYNSGGASLSGVGSGQSILDETTGATTYGFTTETGAGGTDVQLFQSGAQKVYVCVVITTSYASPPTFTANPAVGTRTTSSIPITATSACSDCTFYGVAYTDGASTPSCTQIKAGHDSSNAAAYKSFSVAMTGSVQATGTFSSYTDGTIRDSAYCMNSTAGGDSASVATVADISKIPVSACSYSSATATSLSYSCTLDGAGTIYAVACIKDSTAATVAEVEAAHCTGGVSPQSSTSRSATGSITLSGLAFPIYDISSVGIYSFGTQHEAATHQDFDRYVPAPSGFQTITLASVTATGSVVKRYNDALYRVVSYASQTANFHIGDIVVDTDSGAWGLILVDGDGGASGALTILKKNGTFTANEHLRDQEGGSAMVVGSESAVPTIAVGDIIVVPDRVQPAGAASSCPADLPCLAVDTSGQYIYTANGRQTALNGLVYDVSAGGYMALDMDAYFNNTAPGCTGPQLIVAKTNIAMSTVQLSTLCSDNDTESIHYAVVSGTVPDGLSLDWATGDFSGTPTTENESGVQLIVAVYDVTGDYGTQLLNTYPITSWTVPNVAGQSQTQATSVFNALTFGTVTISASGIVCNAPLTLVTSTSPAAGQEIAPGDTVTLVNAGSCGVPNCLAHDVGYCTSALESASSSATLSPAASCPSTSSVIYSQAPAVGTTITNQSFTLNVVCR